MAKGKKPARMGNTSKTQKYFWDCVCGNEQEVHVVVRVGVKPPKAWECKSCETRLPKNAVITSNK